jgi:hypothetical protein
MAIDNTISLPREVQVRLSDVERRRIIVSWLCDKDPLSSEFQIQWSTSDGTCKRDYDPIKRKCCDPGDWSRGQINTTTQRITNPSEQCAMQPHNLRVHFVIDMPEPVWCNNFVILRVQTVRQSALSEFVSFGGNSGWMTARECLATEFLKYRSSSDPREWKCIQCSRGSSCIGAIGEEEVRPLAGYYRLRQRDTATGLEVFQPCRHKSACFGARHLDAENTTDDRPEGCNEEKGFQTICSTDSVDKIIIAANASTNTSTNTSNSQICRMCTTCKEGYRRSSQGYGYQCNQCASSENNRVMLAIGAVASMFVVYFLVRLGMDDALQGNASDALTRVFINFLQVISVFATYPLSWPKVLTQMFYVQGAVSVLGETMLNPDCELSMKASEIFYAKMIAWSIVPLAIILLTYIIWRVVALVRCTSFRKGEMHSGYPSTLNLQTYSRKPTPKDKFILTTAILLHLGYPSACQNTFRLLACTEIGDGHWYLQADLEKRCWEGQHLDMVFAVCLPQIIIYVVGMPLATLIILHRNRQRLDNPRTKYRWGIFYIGLK